MAATRPPTRMTCPASPEAARKTAHCTAQAANPGWRISDRNGTHGRWAQDQVNRQEEEEEAEQDDVEGAYECEGRAGVRK